MLDVHVDVFQRWVGAEFPPLDLRLDLGETGDDRLHLFPGEEATLRQHLSVGDAPHDVVGGQAPVEIDRGREGLHFWMGVPFEAAAPGLLAFHASAPFVNPAPPAWTRRR